MPTKYITIRKGTSQPAAVRFGANASYYKTYGSEQKDKHQENDLQHPTSSRRY